MRAANKLPDYPDGFKTKRQWAKYGYLPIDDNLGSREWTNCFCQQTALYYTKEQVMKATPEQIVEYERPFTERRNALGRCYYKKRRNKMRFKKAAESADIIPCHNPSGIIVFDLETTGMYAPDDEVLQISIIDGDGNTLINQYVHPGWTKSWSKAQNIHGISPETVADAPYAYELIPCVKGIFQSAHTLISYNGDFDLEFLNYWGIDASGKKHIDVMDEFAPIYAEWDEKHGGYRWQKLVTCARYYGYEFKAHNSLEDVKATLFCYKKIVADTSV